MRPRLRYLIGEPGVGKSTVMAGLTAGLIDVEQTEPGLAWIEWWSPNVSGDGPAFAEIGRRRDTFAGTDALGMGALPIAERWIARAPYPLVVGEGDRLGHPRFWLAASTANYDVSVLALLDPEGAEGRRAERAARVGKAQSEAFVKGRRSRVRRLIEEWPEVVEPISAKGSAAEVLDRVREAWGWPEGSLPG